MVNYNLVGVEVSVDDEVQVVDAMTGVYQVNTNRRFDISPEEVLRVTRVYSDSLQVRTVGTRAVNNYGVAVQKQVSFTINRSSLRFVDPDYVPPRMRKLGETPIPEDLPTLDPEVPIIGKDHPGIQWLFDDMGKYADQQGYCPQYDALCVKLGIPGRPRDFNVIRTMNGITLSTTVKARSQREANELVDVALGVKTAEPDPTPPAPDFAHAA